MERFCIIEGERKEFFPTNFQNFYVKGCFGESNLILIPSVSERLVLCRLFRNLRHLAGFKTFLFLLSLEHISHAVREPDNSVMSQAAVLVGKHRTGVSWQLQ